MSAVQNANSVERALAILECLDSSRRGLNISELSRKLHIPKSSTHVIVLTLERMGYVQKREDSLNYTLGLKAYGLGQGMMKDLSMSETALVLLTRTSGAGSSPSPMKLMVMTPIAPVLAPKVI